jgi:hypothetical protein
MKYLKLMMLLLLGLGANAQTEVNLGDFTGIESDVPLKLELIAAEKAKAMHAKNIAGYTFEIKNGILEIGFAKGVPPSNEPLQIFFVNLTQLELNGAAQAETKEGTVIKGETIEIECNGAAKVNLALEVKQLKLESAGAAKITLSGVAELTQIELAGASKVYAANLKAKDLKLESAGASYFEVYASDRLTIEAAGAAKGSYSGNPAIKNINVSGVANILDAGTGKSLTDERSNPDDTTRISIGKKKFIIIEEGEEEPKSEKENDKTSKHAKKKDLKSVYTGFELGMGNLTSNQPGTSIAANYDFLKTDISKSWFYGFNPYEADMQIIPNRLALTSGIGLEFQHLEFNTDRILTANVSQVTADSGLKAMTRNRLYNFNLSVPLLLKYAPRTVKSNNGFHLAVGVIGSYKAYSHLRLESTANGYEEELKVRDDFNINPFRLTATVRVGYGWLRAFANYSLTPYFNTSNGNPDIRNFTAGLTIIPFDL